MMRPAARLSARVCARLPRSDGVRSHDPTCSPLEPLRTLTRGGTHVNGDTQPGAHESDLAARVHRRYGGDRRGRDLDATSCARAGAPPRPGTPASPGATPPPDFRRRPPPATYVDPDRIT